MAGQRKIFVTLWDPCSGPNSFKQATVFSAFPGNCSSSRCVTFAIGELHWLLHLPNFLTLFFLQGIESKQHVLIFLWGNHYLCWVPGHVAAAEHLWQQFSQSHTQVFVLQKKNNFKFVQPSFAAIFPEQPLLFSPVVRAEMPEPTCMRDSTGSSQAGDRLIERNETELDLSELQIIFHFLLILRTILLCLGHKAAEKQHLDLSLDLRAAVIKRVKSNNFLE